MSRLRTFFGLLCVAASTWLGTVQAGLPGPLERPALSLHETSRAAMLGLAQAGTRVVAVGERGTVLLSDDAGVSWRQAANVPVSATLTAVQFTNEHTGWAVGHYGVVLKSEDGGEHWSRQLDGHVIAKLVLQDAQASGNAKTLSEAQRMVQEGADKPLLALQFQNEREGLVAGAFNLLLGTVDGGKSWYAMSSRLDNPKAAHLYALHREGSELLLAGEQGLLLHSADAGQHFARIATPYAGSFFSVTRDTSGAWLVAGLRGNVLRSTDTGKTWAPLANPVPVSITSVLRDNQGIWLANQAGQLLTPSADNKQLKLVSTTTSQQPASMLRLADGSLLIAGWNGITRVKP